MLGRRRNQPRPETAPPPPPDPLLTLPRVAELIDRDPSRVHRYRNSGQLPPPDEVLAGGTAAWRQSTIRSWWTARGGRITTDNDNTLPRYLEPWEPKTPPGMVEEFTIEWSLDQGFRQGTHEVHVRIFRGCDGKGPVVVLAVMDESILRARSGEWRALFTDVRRRAVTDLDLASPLWIHVDTNEKPSNIDLFELPPVRLYDVTSTPDRHQNHNPPYGSSSTDDLFADGTIVSASDLSRLVGQPIEIFPIDHHLYTPDTIRQREPHLGDDPTPILRDISNVQLQLNRMRTLVGFNRTGDIDDVEDADAINFATGVLAETVLDANKDAEFLRSLPPADSFSRQPHSPDGLTLAVRPLPRILNSAEHSEVEELRLDQPLATRADFSDEPSDGWPPTVVHPQARHQLQRIRRLLDDPNLEDNSRVREALSDAERLITQTLRRNNPGFERADRQPIITEIAADTAEAAAYLARLTPLPESDSEKLDRSLVRRARRLAAIADRYNIAPDAPRVFYLDRISYPMDGLQPGDVLIMVTTETRRRPAGPYNQWEDYEGQTMMVEWPQSMPDPAVFRASIKPGDRLRSPAANLGSRPVFLKRGDLWELLPGGGNRVWGVSSTDTLTPWLHSLFSRRPKPDRYSTPDDSDGTALSDHLINATVRASGSGPLDADAYELAQLYTAWDDGDAASDRFH